MTQLWRRYFYIYVLEIDIVLMQRSVANTIFPTVDERVHPDLFAVRNAWKDNFPPRENGGKKVFPPEKDAHKWTVNSDWLV